MNSRSSSLQLPNAGVANMPPPFLCVVGDQTHSRQTLCPLSPSPGRPFEHSTWTGYVTSLQIQGHFFFCCHVLSSVKKLFPETEGSLSQKPHHEESQLAAACLPCPPNSFNKWLLGACPLPGTGSHTRAPKLHKSPSIVVHSLRKRTEVSLVQLEKGKQDAP